MNIVNQNQNTKGLKGIFKIISELKTIWKWKIQIFAYKIKLIFDK
jgi:hypothetical protein